LRKGTSYDAATILAAIPDHALSTLNHVPGDSKNYLDEVHLTASN